MHHRASSILAASIAALLALNAPGAEAASSDPTPAESVAHAVGVQAHGNEPGWRLVLGPEDIRLRASGIDMQAVLPNAESVPGGLRYSTAGRTVVTVFNRVCADSITGMPYPHAVEVRHANRVLRGCGGEPKSLLRGEWVVDGIDGAAVVADARATLDFAADGRVSGSGSCNTYTAPWRLTPESLSLGPAAATRRACEPALMQQEERFFAVLNQVRRFEVTAEGALVLHGEAGRRIQARRL